MTGASRRLLAAAGSLLALGVSVSVPAAADNGGPAAGVVPVGDVARPGGCGADFFTVDSGLHLLVDLHAVGPSVGDCPIDYSGPRAVTLYSYSTVTLRSLGAAKVNGVTQVSQTARPVLDSARHRLYVVNNPYPSFQLIWFDTHALAHLSGSITPTAAADLPQQPPASTVSTQDPTGTLSDTTTLETLQPEALGVDRGSGAIEIVMTASQSVASANDPGNPAKDMYVAELKPNDLSVHWIDRLAGLCSTSMSPVQSFTNLSTPVMRVHASGADLLVVGCLYYRPANSFGQNTSSDGSMVTAVVHLGPDGMPTSQQDVYLGRPGSQSGLAMPDQNRIFYGAAPTQSSGATAAGPSAVVFDVTHQAYVGATTVSGPETAGGNYTMASGNGRLYGVGTDGIVVVDARQTPLGQGLEYPVYSCWANSAVVDEGTRRIFVVPFSSCKDYVNPWTFSKVQVFEDDSDLVLPVDVPPDSYTSDVPETADTTVSFSGHATATGLRARLVGGARALVDNETVGFYGSATEGLNPPVDGATRDIRVADISAGDLDNYQASGVADAVLADETTRGQFTQFTTVQNPNGGDPVVPGQPFPYKQASCSAPGRPAQSTAFNGETASTTCDVDAGVQNSAVAGTTRLLTDGSLGIDVGDAQASTSTVRNGNDGMIVSATSVVHGITLGAIHIDAVTATTTCKAHGHKGTASCTYTRTISGVDDASGVVAQGSCTDGARVDTNSCATLVAALNSVYQGRLVFTLPSPDDRPGYLAGSPGGYQAVCQREFYEHLQDQTLNYDNSLQVPALEVLYVDDSQTSPSRLDLQFAGIQAEAHYGIQRQSADFGSGDLGGNTSDQTPPEAAPLGPGAPILASTPSQPTPPVVAPPPGRPPLVTLLNKVWDGARLLGRSPGTTVLVASLLSMLGAPLLAAWRRRRLLVALQEGVA